MSLCLTKSTAKILRGGVLLALMIPVSLCAADSANEAAQPLVPAARASSPVIVVGFVGGFVHQDDLRHSEVQLARKLQDAHPERFRVAVFQNWHRKAAHRAILRWLSSSEGGQLRDEERRDARIILFGHSWGAAAAISLARELEQESIPVLLTIQVDSIAKPGQNDRVVPTNVAQAANFYQTRGLLHGRRGIMAADPAQTKILGNFVQEYNNRPAECRRYPWLTRHLFPGHTAIECDPQVWSQVESLIEKYSVVEVKTLDSRAAEVPPEHRSGIHD
jgi:pimeloyl-ACP methyl ester carboxylesterase